MSLWQVFCTKSKPNCSACPMRGQCKHFESAVSRYGCTYFVPLAYLFLSFFFMEGEFMVLLEFVLQGHRLEWFHKLWFSLFYIVC